MTSFKTVLCAVTLTAAASWADCSTLTLSIEHHLIVAPANHKVVLLRTAFTDEPVLAAVALDVYALPQMPSTAAYLEPLSRLPEDTWWQQLQWDVQDAHGGVHQAIRPRLVASSKRERGPNATAARDRDASVACTSYNGTFDLGRLAPGDYQVQVSIAGLQSASFPLAVRTGTESGVRDVYLQEKARRSANWTEFKSLQLERIRLDPAKAAAMLELAHRSLEFGTLEETREYFERAAGTMEHNIAEWAKTNPADAAQQAPAVARSVKQIRDLVRVLPDYFAHRRNWQITRDASGQYVISKRDGGAIIMRVE